MIRQPGSMPVSQSARLLIRLANVHERARYLRRAVLARRGGPDVHDLRIEAEDQPGALALALVLDAPRRLVLFGRRPLPTWLALLVVVVVVVR